MDSYTQNEPIEFPLLFNLNITLYNRIGPEYYQVLIHQQLKELQEKRANYNR